MKFYLVRPKDDVSSIYIDVNHRKNRLRLSTGIVINTVAWNIEKEIASRKEPNYILINNQLKFLRSNIDMFIAELKMNRKNLSPAEFTESILDIIEPDREKTVFEDDDHEVEGKPLSFLEEFNQWIDRREKSEKFSETTIKKYRGCYKKLYEFQRKIRFKLIFENMNMDFYNKFTKYLNQTGLVNNSVGVHVKILKTFLAEQKKAGKQVNTEYRNFKSYKDPEPPTYSLSDKEIENIEKVKLDSQKLIKAKDLFIAQLHLLVRVSDLMKISREHVDIDSMSIKIFVKKTKRPNILPITQKLLKVLEKYDYQLPKVSEQKYNEYLKEIAKLACIDKMVEIARPKGNKTVVEVVPKYKIMSSNMVRRSGITGLLRKKVPAKMIMQISGHKRLAVFERYIKMEEQDSLNAVRNAWNG